MHDKPGKAFQFGLRDLLWITLMAALLLGWLTDRRQTSNRLAQIEAEISRLSEENERLRRREPEIILPRLGLVR